FVTALNYHSYSNLLIYPWGYEEQFPEDFWIYKEIGDSISAYNGFISAPGWITLYSTNGDADDWDYGDLSSRNKIISYTPEVGDNYDGFWPPSYRILPLCQENLGPNLYIAEKAGELYNRPYRFFETQPNFVDTALVSGDSLVLNLRIYGHQSEGNLNWTVSARDSFELTPSPGFFNIPDGKKIWTSNDLISASNSYPLGNWLKVEPQSGSVSPGGYFDHQLILDAKDLPSSCTGLTLHGGVIFYVTDGLVTDSIVVPVTFISGPPKQVSAIATGKVRSDITNLGSINSINGYAWRYLSESYDYLYEGSLFLAYLRSSADTIVYRDLFNTHSFGASSILNIDSSDPRWQKGTFSPVDQGCNLKVRAEVLAPAHPDSSEFMIHRFVVFNLSPDTVKNLYLGMALDWDVPTSSYNSAGYDSSLNLLWQRNTGNQRYAGIAYLSDSVLYGAKAIKNSSHIYNTGDFETGDLYRLASSPGYLIEGSSTDLSSILTAKKVNLAPGDSTKFDLALVSTKVSLDSLKASVRKAKSMVSTYSHGDANGDKKVTISDVVYIVNYLFKGGPAPIPFLAGDANCDGAVTVTDVVYLINYLFKGGPGPCS
ncbi:MAG TPA: M14 family zinc carboxypeptidase, partial [Terriglobales bacterium]|nr:M14 family zinc carboxypeptidase [Terriglobales bacterium]